MQAILHECPTGVESRRMRYLSSRTIYKLTGTPSQFEPQWRRRLAPEITPDMLRPSDLRHGLHMLDREVRRGQPWALALVVELERRKAMLDRIPRGARSKWRTHEWTGRNWKPLA